MSVNNTAFKDWLAAELPQVIFLQNEHITIGGVSFFGGTMWTDMRGGDTAAMHQATWDFVALPGQNVVIDPTRMAHGLLTGIGFLCAGVIFREGFSVHGLTTAASLWTTSAVGVMFGIGMWDLGLIAGGATLLVLAILRFLDARLPHVGVVDVTLRWARGSAPGEATLRGLLADSGLKPVRVGHVVSHDGQMHEHHIKARGPMPLRVDDLSARLAQQGGLAGFSVMPRDD